MSLDGHEMKVAGRQGRICQACNHMIPEHQHGKREVRRTNDRARPDRGFSLLELLIVIAIMFITSTMLIMNIQNATRSVRLNESGTMYANLLQQARIRAVRDDNYYSVLTAIDPNTSVPFAYVDIQQSGSYVVGDPRMDFASGVAPQAYSSGPALSNLIARFLPTGTSSTVNTTAAGPVFGPRGLPCKPTTSGGYTTCPFLTPTSYITFVQNIQSAKWEAVTVTPAGRIRQWVYDESTSSWSPMN
jgi:prepilin-type N-terminal cleavage/methylation domain-containing protein